MLIVNRFFQFKHKLCLTLPTISLSLSLSLPLYLSVFPLTHLLTHSLIRTQYRVHMHTYPTESPRGWYGFSHSGPILLFLMWTDEACQRLAHHANLITLLVYRSLSVCTSSASGPSSNFMNSHSYASHLMVLVSNGLIKIGGLLLD